MTEKERRQYEKLVLTPVEKLIPALAVPTVISMISSESWGPAPVRRSESSWEYSLLSRPSDSCWVTDQAA